RQTGSEIDGQDSLSIIRRRYAHGELTDAQFERKLEQLLKTENLEDVEDHYRSQDRLYECEYDLPRFETASGHRFHDQRGHRRPYRYRWCYRRLPSDDWRSTTLVVRNTLC